MPRLARALAAPGAGWARPYCAPRWTRSTSSTRSAVCSPIGPGGGLAYFHQLHLFSRPVRRQIINGLLVDRTSPPWRRTAGHILEMVAVADRQTVRHRQKIPHRHRPTSLRKNSVKGQRGSVAVIPGGACRRAAARPRCPADASMDARPSMTVSASNHPRPSQSRPAHPHGVAVNTDAGVRGRPRCRCGLHHRRHFSRLIWCMMPFPPESRPRWQTRSRPVDKVKRSSLRRSSDLAVFSEGVGSKPPHSTGQKTGQPINCTAPPD